MFELCRVIVDFYDGGRRAVYLRTAEGQRTAKEGMLYNIGGDHFFGFTAETSSGPPYVELTYLPAPAGSDHFPTIQMAAGEGTYALVLGYQEIAPSGVILRSPRWEKVG